MLDALLDKKGGLSRQIGKAKKAGEPINDLLEEMKRVSLQIKSIKSESKAKRSEEGARQNVELAQVPSNPKLFMPLMSPESQKIEAVDVKLLEGNEHASAWDSYISNKENASIYHHWSFKDIIHKAFGHSTLYVAAFDRSGEICGVLPAIEMNSRLFGHFIVSLPFFTYGGMLAENEAIEEKLCACLYDYAARNNVEHVEIRAMYARKNFSSSVPCKDSKVSMVRALPDDSDQLWSDIGTKVRAQIKKSKRFPLTIKFGKAELINDFYAVFSENMRDLGTPVYSKDFFLTLMKSSLAQQFDIGVVYFKGKPVSCCFLMKHQSMMEIPWASTLNSVNYMNVNMFMYWEVLVKAIKDKCEFFDFGRSTKDAGTYRFKKQWGASPQQLYWYYWLPAGATLPELDPNNPKYKLLINVWQRLPVWVTKLIGPPVVKYLP